ncbi:MAG: hypothetical protein LBN43_02730 [Oscillospiraceae bacterium]|jgi:hypothetical protein|nr:hypothetical protein [Oscillospiraceae bacterium]
MKKPIALVLALSLVAVMFAACTPSGAATTATPAPTAAADSGGTPTADGNESADGGSLRVDVGVIAPPQNPRESDTLAVNSDGTLKYEIDNNGYPVEWYDYVLPLTTSADSFTYFTTSYIPPTMIPPEGMASMDYYTFLRDKTGVNIDYQNQGQDLAAAQTQFSIMLASDDLADINAYASYFFSMSGGGAISEMIDQNFFANVADYRAYAPNFLYQVPRFDYDPDLIATMWLNDEMIVQIVPMVENPMPGTGYCIRGDWLDRLGDAPKASDIRTYDQLLDVLTRFKNEIITNEQGYPMTFFSVVELTAGQFFGGYDTALISSAPATRIVNGEVKFTLSEQTDYDALRLFLDMLDAGLTDPNYVTYATTQNVMPLLLADGMGMAPMNPSEVNGYETMNATPGARWDAIHSPAKTENYQFKYGHGQADYSLQYFGWGFNAKSADIPLIISYADWFYSEEGSWDASWGIEGVTYEYDENGEAYKTDFVINNSYQQTIGFFMLAYSNFAFYEPVRNIHLAGYAYPGGERYKDMMYLWYEDYYVPVRDGVSEMDWPSATAKPTQYQQDDLNTFITDTNTWFTENYAMFLDKSTPLNQDTWDAYVTELYAQGYERYQAIMQNVFDEYLAKRAEIIANS